MPSPVDGGGAPPPTAATQPSSLADTSSSTSKPTTEANAKKKKAPPIAAEAKSLLHSYFTKWNWPLNKNLPRGKYDGELQKIVDKFGLAKTQVSRQLNNYKKERYGHSKIQLTLSSDGIKERLMEGLGMTSVEFANTTLKKLSKSEDASSSHWRLCKSRQCATTRLLARGCRFG